MELMAEVEAEVEVEVEVDGRLFTLDTCFVLLLKRIFDVHRATTAEFDRKKDAP